MLYRAIASFTDYVLINSEKMHVQHFRKIRRSEWLFHEYDTLSDVLDFNELTVSLSLMKIYETIVFALE